MSAEVSPVATVTLDGSGNGQVSLGPPSGAVWRLRLASVSTTSTASQPQCFLYRGSTSGPIEQIDSTYLGNSASSGLVAGAPFYAGQVLWAKWTGGDAGARATLQAYGTQTGRGSQLPFDSAPMGPGFPLNVATVFRAGTTVINAAGEFVYSGTPAAGNLVASIAATSGTDGYGNAYSAGFATYPGAVTQLWNGQVSILPPGSFSVAEYTINGNRELDITAPRLLAGDAAAALSLVSAAAGGTPLAKLSAALQLAGIAVPAGAAGAAILYATVNGTPAAVLPSGIAGQLPVTATDTATNTNTNQATAQAMSASWTIPAGDAQAGTVYEIEVPWDALCVAGNPLRFDLSVDGSATNTVEASFIPGAISPNGFVRVYVQVITTGVSGTINAFINGSFTQNSANGTYTNSAGFAGTDRAKGITFNTTVSHTIRVNSFWPVSSATQTVSGYGSKFTRSGP